MIKRILCICLAALTLSFLVIPTYAAEQEIALNWHEREVYHFRGDPQWYSFEDADEYYEGGWAGEDPYWKTHDQVVPSVIFSSDGYSDDFYTLGDLITYRFEIFYSADEIFQGFNIVPSQIRVVSKDKLSDVFGDLRSEVNLVDSPYTNSSAYHLSEYSDNIIFSMRYVDVYGNDVAEGTLSRFICFNIVFTTKIGTQDQNFAAIMFPSSADFYDEETGESLEADVWFKKVSAYVDPNMSVYEQFSKELLEQNNALLQQLIGSSGVTNEKLDEMNSLIKGDSVTVEDNTGLDNIVSDLEEKENEITGLITAPLTLPDGTTVNVDSSVFSNLKNFFVSNYNAQDYEVVAGLEIQKVFETFMPYVGIVVFLNLMLACALSFLRGSSNA